MALAELENGSAIPVGDGGGGNAQKDCYLPSRRLKYDETATCGREAASAHRGCCCPKSAGVNIHGSRLDLRRKNHRDQAKWGLASSQWVNLTHPCSWETRKAPVSIRPFEIELLSMLPTAKTAIAVSCPVDWCTIIALFLERFCCVPSAAG
jgi:hypothetical protein